MKRSHRLLAVVAALVVAGGALGCGDDDGDEGADPNEYIDELNSAQIDYLNEVTDATTGAAPSSRSELADLSGELESVTDSSADEIEAIEPPEEVADLHDEFVAEMRTAADEFSEAGKAFETGDRQEIGQAADQLQQATSDVQTNLQRIVSDMNEELQN